jgi:polar amino acid transport system substrate-binding protein
MRRPDDALRDATNAAIEKLREDGTVARIYASYGVTLQSPKQ